MSGLSGWRKKNVLALGFKRYYRRALRWARTVALPSDQWQRYQQLCQSALSASLIRAHDSLPVYEERPFNKYLNTRWRGAQKLDAAMRSLSFIENSFNVQALHQLYDLTHRGILLGQVTMKDGSKLSARLSCSLYPREGDLDISLWVNKQEKVYSLSFSATTEGTLYLAGLQGGRGELIKQVTRQSYGLRPKNLLMALIWQFARSYKLSRILGINNQNQVKSRYLKSSYDIFWEECGAEEQHDGWFVLPEQEPIKDIESVKSSKRAEFRRRMALRDELAGMMAQTLTVMQTSGAVSPAESADFLPASHTQLC